MSKHERLSFYKLLSCDRVPRVIPLHPGRPLWYLFRAHRRQDTKIGQGCRRWMEKGRRARTWVSQSLGDKKCRGLNPNSRSQFHGIPYEWFHSRIEVFFFLLSLFKMPSYLIHFTIYFEHKLKKKTTLYQ